jgi:hypothetical protein
VQDASDALVSYQRDKHILKQYLKVMNAYQLLSEDEERVKYLHTLRLRCLASQHINMASCVRDGHFFPFMIFPILERNELRMLELNFLDELLNDCYKDHVSRSYHFSAIKRVTNGLYTDEFVIEFNNSKFAFKSVVQGQRDFIVAMIKTAIEETQMQLSNNKGVNCPDNHNHLLKSKDSRNKLKVTRTENTLKLKIIKDDFLMPARSIKTGWCYKKNETWGKEKRYLLLGQT